MQMMQLAVRLPPEVIQQIDALLLQRKAAAAMKGNWNAARAENRSHILREALDRGLRQLVEEATVMQRIPT